MQHRKPPRPINFKRRLPAHLKNDPQVHKWAKRLLGNPGARPTDLTEEQLAFVTLEVAKRRGDQSWLDPDLLMKAMADTTPVVAAPRLERQGLADDLELLWSQPEMRSFWNSWDGQRAKKGPQPDFITGKAIAMVSGMAGISAHIDDCLAELTGNGRLWQLTERLEDRGGRTIQSYENATRQLPKLYDHELVLRTNVEMIKRLRELHPDAGIGERLMIDGMGRPAWCEQAPKGKTERQEEHRRRFCPEAGARAYTHRAQAKHSVQAGETGSAQTYLTRGKFWRGYYDVCIADQATGLPIVWMSCDAATDEAACIVPLLSDLYRHWGPDCPAMLIVGDSAWDEDHWCRLCEVDYGIHPIFRLHDENKVPQVGDYSRDGSVSAITSRGQLVCAAHRKPMKMVGTESARRVTTKGRYAGDPLRPGQTSEEAKFRIRAECRKGCGRLGLQMQADWSRLTYYPHHGAGSAAIKQRYAMRIAMLRRLNGMEAIWNRLQGGKKLGTADADRTRIRDKDGHDLLVDLGLLSMTAATLADQRRERGVAVPPLPAAPRPGPASPTPGPSGKQPAGKARGASSKRAARHKGSSGHAGGRRRSGASRRSPRPQQAQVGAGRGRGGPASGTGDDASSWGALLGDDIVLDI